MCAYASTASTIANPAAQPVSTKRWTDQALKPLLITFFVELAVANPIFSAN
jgi:hypothetical protein